MPNKRLQFQPYIWSTLLTFASLLCVGTANAATACVWRVTNVSVPFYLVGTVHALAGTDYPLPKAYGQALRDSQRLIFEIKPDAKTERDYNRKFIKAAMYPRGDTIHRHVRPETWAFLEKNFRKSNYLGKKNLRWGDYNFDTVDELRPWAIAFFIWGIRGYNDVFSSHGVDNHLAYQARRMGKEISGLASDDEHIAVLSGMSDLESELILLEALVRGDKRREDFNRMRAAWKRGDIATLWAENQRVREQNPGAELRLLDERNVRWIPRIKAEMKTGKPTAIVAGALHFCGPNGVVELLRRGGYKVEQL